MKLMKTENKTEILYEKNQYHSIKKLEVYK